MRDPRQTIRDRALALGFDAVGFARAALAREAAANLGRFVASGFHGDMGWMAETLERRSDPGMLWPEARSVVALAVNYGPDDDPLAVHRRRSSGAISVYARHRDYHDVVKRRLKALARWMAQELGCGVKVFVDTAPVMEKPFSAQAGLGWQGKHTNLVSRRWGSWLFLGEVMTTLDLATDEPERDHCGACRRCLDACPTRAFPAPYRLDARRCISYLTIEHKGHIAPEFRPAMGNRIYGCDDCLAVCPWNKFARAASDPALRAREDLRAPELAVLAALDDTAFRRHFSGSPIKRVGRDRFVRNVLIAIGNSGDAGLAGIVRERLDDASPLVRAMAVWALARLQPGVAFDRLRATHLAHEPDAQVRAEWGEREAA